MLRRQFAIETRLAVPLKTAKNRPLEKGDDWHSWREPHRTPLAYGEREANGLPLKSVPF